MKLLQALRRGLRAGVRGALIVTDAEARVVELLEGLGDELNWPVHTWSAASGFDGAGKPVPLSRALTHIEGDAPALWVLLDPLAELSHPAELRALREHCQRTRGPAVILVDPSGLLSQRWDSAPVVERVPELWVGSLPPPGREELEAQVRWIGEQLDAQDFPEALAALDDGAAAIARAAQGLSMTAVERLVAEAIVEVGVDSQAIVRFVRNAKPSAVDPRGLLEPAKAVDPALLGGLENFKIWLRRRAIALGDDARAAGIPAPRGVLLLGVQGCGKSLAAQVCAFELDLPLVRLDFGRLFGGTLGHSEANLRHALQAAEAMAPVVLWLDEVDKGLAGVGGARSDGGTAARMVGTLLTWLQERERPVFVAATANQVDAIPPELLRRGRLDEIFFVDLPAPEARAAILEVHLSSRPARDLGKAPPTADATSVFAAIARSEACEGYSGAELEAALTEARLMAFAQNRQLAGQDLLRAISTTIPLSKSRAEAVQALRQWASERARPA